MMTAETDAAVRSAAFEHVEKLSKVYEYFTKSELQGGFYFKGERLLYFGLFCMTIFGLFQTQIW